MKALRAALPLVFAGVCLGQFVFPPDGGTGGLSNATFANPPSSPALNAAYLFTDASATGTCAGGGTSYAICAWNGSSFAAIAGTSTGLGDPGANSIPYRNGSGSTIPATATQMSGPNFCQDAGSTDAYACNLSPVIASYATGTLYWFKANTTNTGAASVNFNGKGALTIKKMAGAISTDLSDSDIRVGQWVACLYDGTNCQMASQLGTSVDLSSTQSLSNKTVDGVSPATLAFLDATSSVQTQLNTKAPLASPALTGTPTAPTPSQADNSTKLATTAYVDTGLGGKTSGPGSSTIDHCALYADTTGKALKDAACPSGGVSGLSVDADSTIKASKALTWAAPSTTTYSSGGTTTIDWSLSNVTTITLSGGDTTLGVPSNQHGSGPYRIKWIQDSTCRTVSFNAVFVGGVSPACGNGIITIQEFTWDGTNYQGGPASVPNSTWHGSTFPPSAFSTLPSCDANYDGSFGTVTDSSTIVLGATVTGSGSNHVATYCNGTNWIVLGPSSVALPSLAAQAADTVVMNASGGSAAPTAVAAPSGGTNGCAGTSDASTYNSSTHTWGCHQISGGGSSTPFDYSTYTISENFASDAAGNGYIGSNRWAVDATNGAGVTGVGPSATWNGGVSLTTAAGSTATIRAFLRSTANSGGWGSLASQTFRLEWLFKVPDGAATNGTYCLGLVEDTSAPCGESGGRNILYLRYEDGTDSVWNLRVSNSGTASTACAGSEAPSSSNYYILKITGSGSSTLSVSLLKSATSFKAAQTGTDIFSSCTATLPAATYAPEMHVNNQTSSANVHLFLGGFFGQFTY